LKRTTDPSEPPVKLVPSTVNVTPALPAVADAGEMDVVVGSGAGGPLPSKSCNSTRTLGFDALAEPLRTLPPPAARPVVIATGITVLF
jgi:hypothetical protein